MTDVAVMLALALTSMGTVVLIERGLCWERHGYFYRRGTVWFGRWRLWRWHAQPDLYPFAPFWLEGWKLGVSTLGRTWRWYRPSLHWRRIWPA